MDKIIGYTTQGASNTALYLTDLELAKQDLANHFKIRKGEKWTNPDFGSNIPLYVMEPLDDITIDLIEQDVIGVVSYDPRFDLIDNTLRVQEDDQTVTMRVELLYLPTTTQTDLVVKFDREFNQNIEF